MLARRREPIPGSRRPFSSSWYFPISGAVGLGQTAAWQAWIGFLTATAEQCRHRRPAAGGRQFRFLLPLNALGPLTELHQFVSGMELARRAFLCEAALALMSGGIGSHAAALALNVSQGSLFPWLRAYRRAGAKGLLHGGEIAWRVKRGGRAKRHSAV